MMSIKRLFDGLFARRERAEAQTEDETDQPRAQDETQPTAPTPAASGGARRTRADTERLPIHYIPYPK